MTKYKVKVKLWANSIIRTEERDPVSKRITHPHAILPARKVVERLVGMTGAAQPAEVYKAQNLAQINEVENKNYDPRMSFDEFIEVLHKEGVIEILERIEEEENKEEAKPKA